MPKVAGAFSTLTSGMLSKGDIDGMMGNNFLKRFNMLIDFRNNKIYLQPNNYYYTPFYDSLIKYNIFYRTTASTQPNRTLAWYPCNRFVVAVGYLPKNIRFCLFCKYLISTIFYYRFHHFPTLSSGEWQCDWVWLAFLTEITPVQWIQHWGFPYSKGI